MHCQLISQQSDSEVLSSTKDVIYTLDLDGNLTFLNEAGELISGYSCEEARRMNITEVVAPEFAAFIGEQIKRHTEEPFGAVYEIDIIAKNGRRVALEFSTHVVVRDGKPIEIQGIAVHSAVRNECLPPQKVRCLDSNFVSLRL